MAIEEEDLNLWQKANNWFDQNIFDFDSLPKGFPFNMSDADNLFRGGESQGETASRFARPQEYPIMNMIEGASTYLENLDSPFKGMCILPDGRRTQVDRKTCDVLGGRFESTQTIEDDMIREGRKHEPGSFSGAPYQGTTGFLNMSAKKAGHIFDVMNTAGVMDNELQRRGLTWTPDVVNYYLKYGRLPDAQGRDDVGGDIPDTIDAAGNVIPGNAAPYFGQEGLLTSREMELRYDGRYAKNAIANKSIFDDAMRQAEARDVLGKSSDQVYNNMEDELFLQQKAIDDAKREQQVRGILDERMSADASAAPAYGAEQAILQEEARIEAERQERLANMQSNIAQQDEMESGFVKYQVTGNNNIDSVISDAIDATVETGTALGENVAEFTADAIEKLGPLVEEGMAQASMLGQEAMGYMQDEVIPAATSLFKDASNAAVATTQSLLADDPADESSSEDMAIDGGKTTDGKTTDVKTNTVTTSTDSSQGSNGEVTTKKQAEKVVKKTFSSEGGFNMDRLTNPLSPENKAWWFEQRPGDIPGNNRAVEFFNALAYIGTPLKYRPAKTPMETLQERRIQHANNLMDATSSRQTAINAANTASYSKLKNMVQDASVLQNRLYTDSSGDNWFARKFAGGLTADEKLAKSWEVASEIEQIMHALAIAGQVPTFKKAKQIHDKRTGEGRPPGDGSITSEEKGFLSKVADNVKQGVDYFTTNPPA